MGSRYDVVMGGQGYLVKAGSYRRWQEGSGETRRWTQSDWRRGCGYLTSGPSPAREGGRWYRGYGVDISEEGRLALGWGWDAEVPTGSPSGFVAMRSFGGYLYGASAGEGKVRRCQGGSWPEQYALPSGVCESLGSAFGELMAGSSDGKVYSFDPVANAWGLRYTRAAGRPVTALSGCWTYEAATHGSVPRLAIGLSRPDSNGSALVEVVTSDEVVESTLECGEPVVASMAEYRGRLLIATARAGTGVGGRLLAWEGNSASAGGELTEVASFSDGSPVSMAVADGLLWIGLSNGRVAASDGVRAVPAIGLVELGYGRAPVRALCDLGGRLFGAFADGALGTCILSREPAAISGATAGLAGASGGWALSSYAGPAGSGALSLASHDGSLYVGMSAPATRRLNPSGYVAAGEAVHSVFDGDDPGREKVFRRVLVGYDALPAGCSVRVAVSRESGSGPWVDLGDASSPGGTVGMASLPAATRARRVWVKLVLSGDGASSPAVRWMALEWSPVGGEMRWEFKARCEGSPTLPLLLKDNTCETVSGEALGANLWAASGSESVEFEDVDGAIHLVRVESLEETIDGLDQGHGRQSVVKVRIVKCEG